MSEPTQPGPVTRTRFADAAEQLLRSVGDTLDPGYAAAARQRANGTGTDPSRAAGRTGVAVLGGLLVGLVLAVAWVHTNRAAPQADRVHDALIDRVHNAEGVTSGLAAQADRLTRRLAAARSAAAPGNGAAAAALSRQELAAGLVAAQGPGLVVTLGNPTAPAAAAPSGAGQRAGSVPLQQTAALTDRDVRSVVNDLWNDGAQAIAVNGVRLAPTTAIRFAGQAVLVDLQPITAPYTIDALGAADTLATNFAAGPVASRYQTLAGVEHLHFGFAESDSLHLAATTPTTVRHARAGHR